MTKIMMKITINCIVVEDGDNCNDYDENIANNYDDYLHIIGKVMKICLIKEEWKKWTRFIHHH